jgi:Domain of unknown function (DUF4217)
MCCSIAPKPPPPSLLILIDELQSDDEMTSSYKTFKPVRTFYTKIFFPQLEKLISKNYFLNLSAKEAFKAYVRSYESHSLKNIFNVQTLDLKAVGRSFGFVVPPHIDIGVGFSKKIAREGKRTGGDHRRDKKTRVFRPAGHGFKNKGNVQFSR